MLQDLERRFSTDIYLRIERERVLVEDLSTGARWDDEPIVLIDEARRVVVGVGREARTLPAQSPHLARPFAEPGEGDLARAIIRHALRSLRARAFIKPRVVVHVPFADDRPMALFLDDLQLGARRLLLVVGEPELGPEGARALMHA